VFLIAVTSDYACYEQKGDAAGFSHQRASSPEAWFCHHCQCYWVSRPGSSTSWAAVAGGWSLLGAEILEFFRMTIPSDAWSDFGRTRGCRLGRGIGGTLSLGLLAAAGYPR